MNHALKYILVFLIMGMYQKAGAFYNPSSGRWLSRDPIQEQGCYNQYAFVENASTLYIDLLGLDILPIRPILPRNNDPDPFCAADCDNQLSSCINNRTFICSLAGGAAGGAVQILNKSLRYPGKSSLFGGLPSGDYTSYTRKWLGKGAGRTIGRIPVAGSAILTAAVFDLGAIASCIPGYNSCLGNCPRASSHLPFPINVIYNSPPYIIIQ